MAEPFDDWHKKKPSKPGEPRCAKHDLYASTHHGRGKRWLARWRDPDGKQQTASFKKREDARKHLSKMEVSIDDGKYVDPKGAELRLKRVAAAWLAGRKSKNRRTYTQYESRIRNHIVGPLGDMKLRKIKPSTVVEWINGRREAGLDETTVGLVLAHLSAIFEQCIDDGLIGRNPCNAKSVRDVKPKRSKRPAKMVPLTGQQVSAVRDHLPPRYKAIADVGRALGLRQGEIFALSPDDVDWVKKKARIRRQVALDGAKLVFAALKASEPGEERERWIPVSDELIFRLTAHMFEFPPISVTLPWEHAEGKPRTVKLFFTSRESKALNRNYFNWTWKSALELAGIIKALNEKPVGRGRLWEECRDRMMHAMRHLYATERLESGMNINTLADRLGHSDPAYTLRKYVHQHETDDEEERRLVDRSLRGSAALLEARDVRR
jgi:integrase